MLRVVLICMSRTPHEYRIFDGVEDHCGTDVVRRERGSEAFARGLMVDFVGEEILADDRLVDDSHVVTARTDLIVSPIADRPSCESPSNSATGVGEPTSGSTSVDDHPAT